ncbi:MAG: hypothetical protein ACJAVN_001930, partial [Roseivirga sp.]
DHWFRRSSNQDFLLSVEVAVLIIITFRKRHSELCVELLAILVKEKLTL